MTTDMLHGMTVGDVEWRHMMDPMDYDDGPLQRLAPHAAVDPQDGASGTSTAPDGHGDQPPADSPAQDR